MASTILVRALRPSASNIESSGYICQACRRHESTYRRTRKALRVKPDPSFLPSKTETQDHIIFNPPPSVANVYHTPSLFLPSNDPRRRLHTRASTPSATTPASTIPSTPSTPAADKRLLPSSVRPEYQKKYHLTPEQVEEIRRLRKEDPRKWTRFFVSLCCAAPEVKAEQDRQLEEIKQRWGRRKSEARDARQERKKLWGQDA
ncbi:hypothetical protein LTR12_007132 [Friedmanniomyces endolithicus]|nr:hypothetical protein LTR74_003808 [Friedmanniomyces endolithicus]KAK1818452.1 hypothetical protein LTR12_007132 [Friedmanniomyces endolithicus]